MHMVPVAIMEIDLQKPGLGDLERRERNSPAGQMMPKLCETRGAEGDVLKGGNRAGAGPVHIRRVDQMQDGPITQIEPDTLHPEAAGPGADAQSKNILIPLRQPPGILAVNVDMVEGV